MQAISDLHSLQLNTRGMGGSGRIEPVKEETEARSGRARGDGGVGVGLGGGLGSLRDTGLGGVGKSECLRSGDKDDMVGKLRKSLSPKLYIHIGSCVPSDVIAGWGPSNCWIRDLLFWLAVNLTHARRGLAGVGLADGGQMEITIII